MEVATREMTTYSSDNPWNQQEVEVFPYENNAQKNWDIKSTGLLLNSLTAYIEPERTRKESSVKKREKMRIRPVLSLLYQIIL